MYVPPNIVPTQWNMEQLICPSSGDANVDKDFYERFHNLTGYIRRAMAKLPQEFLHQQMIAMLHKGDIQWPTSYMKAIIMQWCTTTGANMVDILGFVPTQVATPQQATNRYQPYGAGNAGPGPSYGKSYGKGQAPAPGAAAVRPNSLASASPGAASSPGRSLSGSGQTASAVATRATAPVMDNAGFYTL